MIDFIKDRWALFLVLVIFIICKIPHLSYPYCWDEGFPYAAAIRAMYAHGASLMPSAIDPELSRGHPLLFHAAAVTWMNIFGTSHMAMHSFSLCTSVLFLAAIYETGLRMYNRQVALLVLLLIATLMIFFIQSAFVLLEIPLAFLCFISLVCYVNRKYVPTALCLTAAFYTKESGLVLGVVLGIDAVIGLFTNSEKRRDRICRLLSVVIPCLLAAAFFLVQKHEMGWYIFPLHNDYIKHDWYSIWSGFRMNCIRASFDLVSKQYYFLLLLFISLLAAARNRDVRYLAPFIPAAIIYLLVDDRRGGDIKFSFILLALFIAAIVYMGYLLRKLKIYNDKRQESFIVLSAAFVFLFLCFSSMSVFIYRYLLASIIPLFFILGVIIEKFVERTSSYLYYPVLLLILTISYFSFKTDRNLSDFEPGAFAAMNVQQKEVDFLEHEDAYNKPIACGSFLTREHLTDPATGYLRGPQYFGQVKWGVDPATIFVVFNDIDHDYRYAEVSKDTSFHMVYRYADDMAWTEIYKRR